MPNHDYLFNTVKSIILHPFPTMWFLKKWFFSSYEMLAFPFLRNPFLFLTTFNEWERKDVINDFIYYCGLGRSRRELSYLVMATEGKSFHLGLSGGFALFLRCYRYIPSISICSFGGVCIVISVLWDRVLIRKHQFSWCIRYIVRTSTLNRYISNTIFVI